MNRLTGLIPAAFTPMTEDGSVNFDRIPDLVEHFLDVGLSGLYVLGSTGEGVSLTSEERRQTAEAYIAAVAGRCPVIIQIGHTSLKESRALAAHASQAGASAISATPPSYFRPNTIESVTDCMAEIAGGAPDLPFYYYHIPSMTGVTVEMPDFLMQASKRIPNLVGVKFTSPAIWEYQMCVELDNGRFDCLYGHDEMLLPGLAVGAKGAVGTTYNFSAPLFHKVIKAFEVGDLPAARLAQAKATQMIRTLLHSGGLGAFKATMSFVGIDCGPVRAPLVNISPEARSALRNELEESGFLEEIRKAPTT